MSLLHITLKIGVACIDIHALRYDIENILTWNQ